MWEKLRSYLTGRGFPEVNLHRDGMMLFYAPEGKSAKAVWVIGNTESEPDREQYGRYLATIRNIFEKQGFVEVDVLTLFVTDRIDRCREIGEGSQYWIVDERYGRLVVYEDQPGDYLGIRSVVENNLHFGGQSRNAEGAQVDLSNNNLRAESRVQPILRSDRVQVADNRGERYMAEVSKRQTMARAQRRSKLPDCFITILLIAVNLIIFLFTDLFGFRDSWFRFGEMSWADAVNNGEFYRALTCMFLHSDIGHISGNMVALFLFGNLLEKDMSKVRYTILYLVSGIGSSFLAAAYYQYVEGYDVLSIGASGAIFGLMGAFVVMVLARPEYRANLGPRLVMFFAYLVYTSVRAGAEINVAAHVSGFLVGMGMYLILAFDTPKRARDWRKKQE